MKIAVIGSGIAGNAAAWALHPHHDVVVYEKRHRMGGHSATVDIRYDGHPLAVDTGFIVFNERNYPNLCALFDELNVATEWIDMSFSVSLDKGDFEWSGDHIGSVFAQKRNLVSPPFWRMLVDIVRFNRLAAADLAAGRIGEMALGSYLEKRRFSAAFTDHYLAPMGAAIWSTPHARILDFPARSFIQFLANHKLLAIRPPDWMTVSGGSRVYVDKMMAPLQKVPGKVRLGTSVVAVERSQSGVTVIDAKGHRDSFDQLIVATHSDQALALLGDSATADERALLGAIGYGENAVYLHRDPALMPKRRRVWSAWNYVGTRKAKADNTAVTVSYWMNVLQNIDKRFPLFVSLNPVQPPDPAKTFERFSYAHPQFDQAALSAQTHLPHIQGTNRTWFCGAWCGYGFHEDGLTSGLAVAQQLGGSVPWRQSMRRDAIRPPLPEAAE